VRSIPVLLSLFFLAASCSSSAPDASHDADTQPTPGDDSGHGVADAGHGGPKKVDAGHDSSTGRSDAQKDAKSTAVDAPSDTSPSEASIATDGNSEAGTTCSVDGEPGQCITTTACAAQPSYESTPGYCPGPADIECCRLIPNVADNPPTPVGYKLMAQADVTAAMTTWAVDILNDPTIYPMFSTAMMMFGSLNVLARVEWHPPDSNNESVHRGVTLYEPIDGG
jgi:hypothetical protein